MELGHARKRLSRMQKKPFLLVLALALLVGGCGIGDSSASGESQLGDVAAGSPDAFETGDPNPEPEVGPTPSIPAPFHFVAIGDFGDGSEEQQQIADRMCSYRERHPYDLVVTTGDNIYDAGEAENFRPNFFEPYDCLLSNGVDWHASLGNHDVATNNGRPELQEPAFGMLARNYVVRRNGVRFVIANSNNLDVDWLRAALTAQPGDLWTIAVFHHPVFSGGDEHGATPGFSDALPSLFARKGVDLVLNGHDHVYSVTHEVKGVRYVVTGGGGARGYGCKDAPKVIKCLPQFHFLSVTAGPTELTVKAIPRAGGPIHRFTTDGV